MTKLNPEWLDRPTEADGTRWLVRSRSDGDMTTVYVHEFHQETPEYAVVSHWKSGTGESFMLIRDYQFARAPDPPPYIEVPPKPELVLCRKGDEIRWSLINQDDAVVCTYSTKGYMKSIGWEILDEPESEGGAEEHSE